MQAYREQRPDVSRAGFSRRLDRVIAFATESDNVDEPYGDHAIAVGRTGRAGGHRSTQHSRYRPKRALRWRLFRASRSDPSRGRAVTFAYSADAADVLNGETPILEDRLDALRRLGELSPDRDRRAGGLGLRQCRQAHLALASRAGGRSIQRTGRGWSVRSLIRASRGHVTRRAARLPQHHAELTELLSGHPSASVATDAHEGKTT